jgi:deoxyribose-phosphate aldolase
MRKFSGRQSSRTAGYTCAERICKSFVKKKKKKKRKTEEVSCSISFPKSCTSIEVMEAYMAIHRGAKAFAALAQSCNA